MKSKHFTRWRLMINYQKKIWPFHATLTELVDLWGLSQKSGARNTIKVLHESGYVLIRRNKKWTQFYAIDPLEG